MPVIKIKNNGVWENLGGTPDISQISASEIGALTVDLENKEYTIPQPSNADMLGQIPAEEYALKTNVEEVKTNLQAQIEENNTNLQTAMPAIYSQSAALPISGWITADDGTISQTIAIEGITIDVNKTNAIVSPSTDRAIEEEYLGCEVRASSQEDGILTFTCTSIPSIDLEANVMVLIKGGIAR